MEAKNINKIIEKEDLSQNDEIKQSINGHNFIDILSRSLVLNQIFKFFEKDDIKSLALCSKKINKCYCGLVKKLNLRLKINRYQILILINILIYMN